MGDKRDEGMQVTIMRHAESLMNLRREEVVGGRSNHTPLTAKGRAAAVRLGRDLADGPAPDLVVNTSAVRSTQTAQAIIDGAEWNVPVLVEDGFLELSQGAAEGQPRGQWWTPQMVAAMNADPLGHRLAAGGESHREVQERMRAAVLRVAGASCGGWVLVIGHGIAMRTLGWSILGGGHDVFTGLSLPNLGRVDLTVTDTRIQLAEGTWPSFPVSAPALVRAH